MSDTIRVGDRTFTILFPDLLRPLGARERQDLKNSIRKRGVLVPIAVDEFDGVIDGGNRVTLAAEVGLNGLGVEVYRNLSLEKKAELALALNEFRRHLTPEEKLDLSKQRQAVAAKACELYREGLSQRDIATQTGTSQATVSRLLLESAVAGDSGESPATAVTTQGADGKTYLPPAALEERREKVAELVAEGMSQREIAKEVGIDVSQVNRDIKAFAKAEKVAEPEPLPEPEGEAELATEDPTPLQAGECRIIEDDGDDSLFAPAGPDEDEAAFYTARMNRHLSHARKYASYLGLTLREAVDAFGSE